MIWLGIFLLVLLMAAFALFVGPYNGLVRLRNTIQESWRQVDVELNRRYDLIPNLVETVKGYASYEHNTLSDIVALRNHARQLDSGAQAPGAERSAVESQLSGAVSQVLAIAEAYPQLKADAGFRQLSDQLAGTEDRIANSRRYYNAVVGDYNTKIESFPNNIAANIFHFEKASYFQIDDPSMRQNPSVDFSGLPDSSASTSAQEKSNLGVNFGTSAPAVTQGQAGGPVDAPRQDAQLSQAAPQPTPRNDGSDGSEPAGGQLGQ